MTSSLTCVAYPALIAFERKSPAQEGKHHNPPISGDDLPALRASSDLLWGIWQMVTGQPDKAKNLQSLFSISITNEEALSIIKRALGDDKLKAWPGTSFSLSSDQGKALLGMFIHQVSSICVIITNQRMKVLQMVPPWDTWSFNISTS